MKLLILVIFVLTSFSVFALEINSPIDISSDRLEVSPEHHHALFQGDVKVKHGEVRLGAENISIYYAVDGGDVKEVVATEKVVIVHGSNTATGDKATYNPNIGDVIITGNVVMTSGESVLKGQKLVYDMKTGHMSLANPQGNGRVKATFSLKGNK